MVHLLYRLAGVHHGSVVAQVVSQVEGVRVIHDGIFFCDCDPRK